MTEPGYSERPARGRGFETAMLVIGVVALIQVGAMVAGILRSKPAPVSVVAPSDPVPPIPAPLTVVESAPAPVDPVPAPTDPVPAPPLTETTAPAVSETAPDPGPTRAPITPAPAPRPDRLPARVDPAWVGPAGEPVPAGVLKPVEPQRLFDELKKAAPQSPLEDAILESLLVAGVELRANGNNQGALKNFREVETALPDHPRVLSEIGATLTRMGLEEKSKGYWERVETLGELAAGPWFAIAGMALHGAPEVIVAASAPAIAPAPLAPGQLLRIGEVKVEEEAPSAAGQKVSLTITVDADPTTPIIADDIFMTVPFYDQLAGGEVRPSTAETSYEHPSAPYLWDTGSETIVVTYSQPVFTEEQKREVGERSFYGYAIELYYRGELQDKVAMPGEIAALREEAVRMEPPRTAPAGPENALFPTP